MATGDTTTKFLSINASNIENEIETLRNKEADQILICGENLDEQIMLIHIEEEEVILIDSFDVLDWNYSNLNNTGELSIYYNTEGDNSQKLDIVGTFDTTGYMYKSYSTMDLSTGTLKLDTAYSDYGTSTDRPTRIQIRLGTNHSNYSYWEFSRNEAYPAKDTQYTLSMDINSPDGTVGSPDLSDVTYIELWWEKVEDYYCRQVFVDNLRIVK